MPQTIVGSYLSILSWFFLVISIYYPIMKIYILPNIRSKLYIRSNIYRNNILLIKEYPIYI